MEDEIKTHNLKTIQDIYDCLNEDNIENFIIDFRIFAVECVKAKMLHNVSLDLINFPREGNGLQINEFQWIEDGKHENHGTIISCEGEKLAVDISDWSNPKIINQ